MSAQHLRDLENRRRHATLIAVLLDTEATITDQILDMHDRIVGRMFNEAKRKHEQGFAESGKAINEKVPEENSKTLAKAVCFNRLGEPTVLKQCEPILM